jgi:uncharacterized protein (DUF305 family)
VRTTAIRGTTAAVLISAAVLTLAGCVNAERSAPAGAGASQSYGPAPTTSSVPSTTGSAIPASAGTQHNASDVTFVDQALPLRQQAITLANTASRVSTNAQIRTLATQLAADTLPSVTTMTGWLAQWGQPVPAAVPGQVPGLLTDAQVQQLNAANGTAFDMQWLQGIHGNLTAAQQAANTETSKGANPASKQLAQQWAAQLRTELTQLTAITG